MLIPTSAQAVILVSPPATNCTSTDSRWPTGTPIAGQDYCFDSVLNQLMGWSGTAFIALSGNQSTVRVGVDGQFVMPNGATYTINNYLAPSTRGALDQYGLGIKISGGTTGGGISRVGIGVQATSGGGASAADQVEAANFLVQQNSTDAAVTTVAIEANVNNNKTDDAAGITGPLHIGYSAVSDGNKIAAYAYGVGGAAKWRQGFRVGRGSIASGGAVFYYVGDGTNGAFQITSTGALAPGSCAFANLGTCLTANGQMIYCPDCNIANPCTSGGKGAMAKLLNNVKVCN